MDSENDDILIQYYLDGQEGIAVGTYDSVTVTTEPESVDTLTPQSTSPQITQAPVEMDSIDVDPEDIPEDRQLRGLDLFCGGGNFGRGVADGGGVRHNWFSFS